MDITIDLTITQKQLCDIVVTAFEGGANYWLHDAVLKSSKEKKESGLVWYGQEHLFTDDLKFEVGYDLPTEQEGRGTGRKLITMVDFKKGLQLMARAHAKHFADFTTEDYDATTGDVFMQCVVLGDVVYG